MTGDRVVQDRSALYYPYIQVRDVNWLKATLLCFPQVMRIVPEGFTNLVLSSELQDVPEIAPFRNLKGPGGQPMLMELDTETKDSESPVTLAQERLLKALRGDIARLKALYDKSSAIQAYGDRFESYRLFTGKIMWDLNDYMREQNLAWFPSDASDGQLAMHPRLGEAIMSVIAIALARARGLDIVTSDGVLHHALAVLDEDEAVDTLLNRRPPAGRVDTDAKVGQLAQVVMTTAFDLEALSAHQIAELVKEGQDLRAFKHALIRSPRGCLTLSILMSASGG